MLGDVSPPYGDPVIIIIKFIVMIIYISVYREFVKNSIFGLVFRPKEDIVEKRNPRNRELFDELFPMVPSVFRIFEW